MIIIDQSSYVEPKDYSAVPNGGVFTITAPSLNIYLKTAGGSFKVTDGSGPLVVGATDTVLHYLQTSISLYTNKT